MVKLTVDILHPLISYMVDDVLTHLLFDCRDGAIPAVTLILGGNLLRGNKHNWYWSFYLGLATLVHLVLFFVLPRSKLSLFLDVSSSGLKGSGIQKSIILGVIVARYIALPLMGIVIVKGALRFGFVHENPLYQFVLLLQFAVPPAMNIGLIIILVKLQICISSSAFVWPFSLYYYWVVTTTHVIAGLCRHHNSVVWSWWEWMFRYYAVDLCTGFHFTYSLVHLLHVVGNLTWKAAYAKMRQTLDDSRF